MLGRLCGEERGGSLITSLGAEFSIATTKPYLILPNFHTVPWGTTLWHQSSAQGEAGRASPSPSYPNPRGSGCPTRSAGW